MVGNLGVGDVGTDDSRHMAAGAVGLRGVMFGREVIAVTRQTLFAVIGDTIFCGWLIVWIVATGAGHGVSRFSFAHALRQRLDLADTAQSVYLTSGQDVIAHGIGKRVSRLEVIGMTARTLNRYFCLPDGTACTRHRGDLAGAWRD